MQQASVVKFDFGLRAIKAIISIAENMKQQVANIWESDLPDIVNEDNLDRVPYRAEQIIKDVQLDLDPTPEQVLEAEELKRQNQLGRGAKSSAAMGSSAAAVSTVANAAALRSSVDSSIFSQTITEEISTVQEEEEAKGEENQDEEQKDSDDSVDEKDEMPEKQKKLQGAFFRQVFGQVDSWRQRQTKVLMKQIGLKANQRMTEIELEEYIIVKAVKDFNTSKFSHDMLHNISGIIADVFLGSVPKLQPAGSDYSNLTELVFSSFQTHKLDYNKKMNDKAFQLYEIVAVKQGVILLGDTQSGKSTLVRILETALNKAMGNELKLRMAALRKDKLREIAVKHFEDLKAEEENPKERKGKKKRGDFEGLDGMGAGGAAATKKEKKKGKKNAAKSRNQLWLELYKKSKLEKAEIEELKEGLVQRGVQYVRLNPKAVQLTELFGEVNRETYVWTEGQFTEAFRRFSLDKSTTKSWIHLDGPVDHYWVENLNSILDENRKMNLPNGETINLSDHMCLLLETDALSNVTPATISRCGLVYLAREDVNRPKQIFNQYLGRLPPNLQESVRDIENQTNWLMVECLRVFDNERHRGELLLPGVDHHWIVQNYVKLLDTFFSGYWNDFIK